MKRMSPPLSDVSKPTRSPGRSSTGPDVVRMPTLNSLAMSSARVVLPRPGGPKNNAWSSGSRRCFAASMAIWSDSLTLAWPTNSSSRDGRSAASALRSSGRASGVVICARAGVMRLSSPAAAPASAGPPEPLTRRRGGPPPPAPPPAPAGRRRRTRRVLKLAQLVGQFKRQPLGGLLADAAHRGEQPDVALLHGASATLHAQRRHERDGDLRAHPRHADEPLEKATLRLVLEAVQRPPVVAHDQLGGEAHGLAHGGKPLHDAQGDDDLVADAARRVDHHAIGLLRGEPARDPGDHARRM